MLSRGVVAVGCKVAHRTGDAGGGGWSIAGAGTVTGSHPQQTAAHNSGGYSGVWLRHSPCVSIQAGVAARVVTCGALGGGVM